MPSFFIRNCSVGRFSFTRFCRKTPGPTVAAVYDRRFYGVSTSKFTVGPSLKPAVIDRRYSGESFWESLLDNLDESGHFFVSFSAENVTGKRKHARFVWYKPYVFDHSRFDIHSYVKLRKLESMMPVL